MDGKMLMAWKYICSNKHLEIPDSWQECIADFDRAISELALWDEEFCHTYVTCPRRHFSKFMPITNA